MQENRISRRRVLKTTGVSAALVPAVWSTVGRAKEGDKKIRLRGSYENPVEIRDIIDAQKKLARKYLGQKGKLPRPFSIAVPKVPPTGAIVDYIVRVKGDRLRSFVKSVGN